jgi:hypothetical protein
LAQNGGGRHRAEKRSSKVKRAVLLTMLALCLELPAARAAESGLEYRLKVQDGVPFAFDHAEEQSFSPLPFMTAADFESARARKSDNPNTPGDWEVVLTHTAVGRAKIRAVADADRSREYCLVFHGTLYQCLAFPPVVKGVYDKGLTFGSRLTQAMAVKLAGEMEAEIKHTHGR